MRLSTEQIEMLDDNAESGTYSDLEKSVIAFSEQMTQKATVDDSVMLKLKESLSPEHLVKLTAAVGQANWTNRFNNAFGVELP